MSIYQGCTAYIYFRLQLLLVMYIHTNDSNNSSNNNCNHDKNNISNNSNSNNKATIQ